VCSSDLTDLALRPGNKDHVLHNYPNTYLEVKKNDFSNPSISSKVIRRRWANDTDSSNLCLSFLTKQRKSANNVTDYF
jgi:hypothetical protein